MYADLHRHLDGSLRPSTLSEFAAAAGLRVPEDLTFIAGMGLDEALARFAFTLSVLRDAAAVRRIASEMCEDAAADGVTTLEIRFAPQLHVDGSDAEIVDAALEGIDGRAGLILCGLYGEPPAVLEGHVDLARSRPGVVAIDLAGGPAPGHSWRIEDYRRPYHQARDLGLGRTVHAGEGRPPAEIRVAIELLDAQRIGHGTTLLHDPEVLDLVLGRGVTIEACPTSNVHTSVLRSVADHPLVHWLEAGVSVCVCTDNTLLSQVSSSEEHTRIGAIPGMTAEHLRQLIDNGHQAAFAARH